MRVFDYLRIGIVSFILFLAITIFSGMYLLGIIIATACFSILIKLKKKQVKHDIKITTKYVMESIKEIKENKDIK